MNSEISKYIVGAPIELFNKKFNFNGTVRKLRASEIFVYCFIYSKAKASNCPVKLSLTDIAKSLELSLETVANTIRKILNLGLVYRTETVTQNNGYRYRTFFYKVNQATRGWSKKITPPKGCVGGRAATDNLLTF